MTDLPQHGRPARRLPRLSTLPFRLAASPAFQAWAARVPVFRLLSRREGQALFDLTAGFVHSQILMAVVELQVIEMVAQGPLSVDELARRTMLPADRAQLLAQGAAALGLLKRRRDGRFAATTRGAALTGVPGLADMIRHHKVLYADLADPVAFLRGETSPRLAGFWPYVFGAAAAENPEVATRYSRLMSESQAIVAAETLRLVDLGGVQHLMDVGGGTGAFLTHAGQRYPSLRMTLFDLPSVVANARFTPDLAQRISVCPGSFRDDPLAQGADCISLVRVFYDHADDTVKALAAKVFAALPPGGRVIVSEPMSGGTVPDRNTDTYFALYTAAMGTGKVRSSAAIAAILTGAGFGHVRERPGDRSYVTSVVEARRVE